MEFSFQTTILKKNHINQKAFARKYIKTTVLSHTLFLYLLEIQNFFQFSKSFINRKIASFTSKSFLPFKKFIDPL